jgi:undecaprenyl diphosphate synthase
MDGNRRWSRERNLPTLIGHRRGLTRLLDLLPALRTSEIEVLTLFGFSSANWQRDQREISYLLELADEAIRRFSPVALQERIRVEVIGRRDRLPGTLVRCIERTERATCHGNRLLRVAVDYSSREAIVQTAQRIGRNCDAEQFAQLLAREHTLGNVDLLIRTGKEQRLSDFLLWECAFAELYFLDLYWPDFDAGSLQKAIVWYQQRNRRFGV